MKRSCLLSSGVLLLSVACSSTAPPADEGFASGRGLGIALHKGAMAYVGSGSFCTRPATIDAAVVTAATPEWQEIQRDAVREGSARHSLLKSSMHDRVVAACRKAAQAEGCDLVVRTGDIADSRGMQVVDLTPVVLRGL